MSGDLPVPPSAPPPAPFPPLPAVPLAYAYQTRGRPGIITAIGVISIVVASIGIMGSGLSGLYGFGLFMASQISNSMTAVSRSLSTANVSSLAVEDSENGLLEPDRSTVMQVVSQEMELGQAQQTHFDALLAQHGETIFQFAGQPVTAQDVRTRISDSGPLPAEEPGSASPGTYFVTGWGTVELYDDRAMFLPQEENESPITAVAGGGVVSDEVAEQVVRKIQASAKPSSAQVTAVKRWITTSAGPYDIDPDDPAGSIIYAGMMPDGGLNVFFATGQSMQWDRQGKVVQNQTSPFTTTSGPLFQVSSAATSMVMLEAVASLGAAIYLLVIGILTLRQSLRARRLHLVYAWIKIPLALGFAAAWAWAISSLIGGGGSVSWVIVFTSAMAGLACVYPVALLIALNRPSVREYYGMQG